MPSSLIHEVASYCWSHNFLDVFHAFFRDYAEEFIGAPEICAGEVRAHPPKTHIHTYMANTYHDLLSFLSSLFSCALLLLLLLLLLFFSTRQHELKYYDLFTKYLNIYEATLVEYLKTLNCSIEDFYREVREVQDEGQDAYLNQFIRCLLASADYESFYRVMYKEGKKKALELKTAGPTVPVSMPAEAKGEAKVGEYGDAGSKGGTSAAERADDYDDDFKSEGKSSYK
jgi:hypothetical protein